MWDSDFNIVGAKNGSPNIVLKTMGLEARDHDKMVGEDNSTDEIVLQNTSAEIIKRRKLEVKKQHSRNFGGGGTTNRSSATSYS